MQPEREPCASKWHCYLPLPNHFSPTLRPLTPGYTREIVFLTDGGVDGGSERAVHDLVTPPPPTPSGTPLLAAAAADLRNRMRSGSAAAASTHVHCLGIGHGVHRSLVDGMATRSSGACVYVADGEPLGPKVAFLKRCALAEGAALRPRITARGAVVRAAPHVLPARVFAGEPVRVLLEVVASEADAELVLEAEYGVEGAAGEGGWLAISLPLGKEAAAAAAAAAAAGGNGAGGGDGSGAVEGEALGVLHAMAYIGCLMVRWAWRALPWTSNGFAFPTCLFVGRLFMVQD